MSVGSHDRRVARKAHTCEECRRTIPAGATYHYITGLFDGSWWSVKLCARCDRAWDRAHDRGALIDAHDEDGPTFGELTEWLKDWRGYAVWRLVPGQKLTPLEAVRKRRERRRYHLGLRAHLAPECRR